MSTSFAERVGTLRRVRLDTLQVNLGKFCNLACNHCHVEAGPKRTERMDAPTAYRIGEWLAANPVARLDLTGGAPELNGQFRFLVRRARQLRMHVMDRCNLTVLFEPGQEDLAEFLASERVEVIASLPCYAPENVAKQRGNGVFEQSIAALQWLNRLGYGLPESGLVLNLVYNPVGTHLPPAQAGLQAAYRRELGSHFGIVFNQLFTITNMPIRRFLHYLNVNNRYKDYMQLLIDGFNPGTVAGLMCRNLLSVDWQGRIFDCDFNQMLELAVPGSSGRFLWDYLPEELSALPIATAEHCWGCTAGSGSGCGGALV